MLDTAQDLETTHSESQRRKKAMRRNIGKMLISLAAILTAVVPFLADWNDSHLFSPQWSPHARFHGVVSLGMTTMLSSVALWLLWRRSPDQDTAVTVAAAIPVAYWGPFFLAPFVSGTTVEDPGHRLVRIIGVPSNLMGAGATALTAGLGGHLDRPFRTTSSPVNFGKRGGLCSPTHPFLISV